MSKATETMSPSLQEVLPKAQPLGELFWIFFKIGSVAFGGYMALIAAVESVIVERKRLLTHEELLDATSLASILPGPMAVNVCAYVGHRLRGGLGALVTTVGVVLPSFILCTAFSYLYFKWGNVPAVSQFFSTLLPAILAIILVTAWNMAKKTFRSLTSIILATISAATVVFVGGYIGVLILLLSGSYGYFFIRGKAKAFSVPVKAGKLPVTQFLVVGAILSLFLFCFLFPLPSIPPNSLLRIFNVFSGMSLMLFGGGYVFIPLIQRVVVEGLKWVTTREFVDALAIGQFTPGPILISATFIGFKVAQIPGAIISTIAIFLPPALLMVTVRQVHERLKHTTAVSSAMNGVRPAVVGMIAGSVVVLGRTSQMSASNFIVLGVALFSLLRLKLSVFWLIPLSALLGFILKGIGL